MEKRQQNTSRRYIIAITAILTFICMGGPQQAKALSYSALDLGTLGGSTSYAQDINDSGHVVGHSDTTDGNHRAFLYNGTSMIDLGTLGGSGSWAYGINNAGQVVGQSQTTQGYLQSFLHNGSNMINLGTLDDSHWSRAKAINDSGYIVGTEDSNQILDGINIPRAFLHNGANMIDLGTLDGGVWASAEDINDSGNITGASGNGSPMRFDNGTAFLRNGTDMIDLGTLGGPRSEGLGVNNQGHVVGWSTIAGSNFFERAFLYNGTSMIDLGTLGGAHSAAADINDSGYIVGGSNLPNWHTLPGYGFYFGSAAFLYSSGTMWNLNDLLNTTSTGIYLTRAYAINIHGQIAAQGYNAVGQQRAYLLTPESAPVPEPTTILLFASGLAGLAAVGRRRKS